MSKHKFITQYGRKKLGANEFTPEMDRCDQRAPILTPFELYQQYVQCDEEVMQELEEESIEDFDDDVYDYEDISEYGEDILTAQQPEIAMAGRRLAKSKKSNRTL